MDIFNLTARACQEGVWFVQHFNAVELSSMQYIKACKWIVIWLHKEQFTPTFFLLPQSY